MTQKCNGVKILDLEGKDKFTGNEYVVVAEKDENYKIPMEQIGDVIINGSKFKAAIEKVYTSSTPTAAVTLADSEFKFSFGIPPGERGDNGYNGRDGKDGKDGKDGIDGVPGIDGDTVRTILAYKSTTTTTRPATPVGGSWDATTNIVIYPDGWTGNDANPNGYVWMSSASFSSNGTQMSPWTTPLRLTGDDGKDGSDGTNIEFIYKLTISSLVIPTKPTGNSQQEAIDNWGWTDHPTGISEEFQCEWVCSHSLQEDGTWGEWQGPTIWSKWGVNGKDGDGVEYIFQRTRLPAPPHDITDNNPDQDEYIPASYPGEERWTDNPSGVNETFKYEWVSKRKYKGDTHKWDNFSSPSMWAKYGDDGQDGIGLRVMYTRTSGSDVQPRDPDRLNINPGSIWGVGMPTTVGKEAIWGIQALVTYDNKLFIDENVPVEKRGWQGPYLITGVPGLDGNNFNYQVDAFIESTTEPERPTSNDPYNPGGGWKDLPDSNGGVWWKSTALVQGETGIVIEWGPPIKVSGQGIVIKGTLGTTDDLPMTGNNVGDAYVIDGYLWVWNGEEWINVGTVQGADGNYYEYRFARNNSWQNAPSIVKDDRYPSGWSTGAPALSSGRVLWATFALISGVDNSLMTDWAEPYYMTGMSGENGGSGIPGVGYEVRYCKGTETSYTATWNDTVKYTRDPQSYGWDLDVPELVKGDEYNYIWYIQARIIDDQFESGAHWSKPNPMGGIITPTPIGSQPIAYPAGIYNVNTPYINDGEKAPYVYDTSDGNFYFLKSVMTWLGTQQNNVSPATDTSGAWTVLENYEAIYTDLLIAPNSLVGGAVFNNNLMFSQRGKDASGGDTADYPSINTDDPMNTSNSFRPNFLLDFKKGEAWFGAGGIHLAADPENSAIILSNATSSAGGKTTSISLDGIGISKQDPSASQNNMYMNMTLDRGLFLENGRNAVFQADQEGIRFRTNSGSNTVFNLDNDGAGSLASGGISWDTSGNLTIGKFKEFSVIPDSGLEHGKVILYKDMVGFNPDQNVNGLVQFNVESVSNSIGAALYVASVVRGSQYYIEITSTQISFRNGLDGSMQGGWTGTKNGLKFQGGVCVGEA